jgi:hypothetical protein
LVEGLTAKIRNVSSANNLHNPSISSAMSLLNIKTTREARVDTWGTPAFKFPFNSMVNIDINNITHWAKQWLVKLNPEKKQK